MIAKDFKIVLFFGHFKIGIVVCEFGIEEAIRHCRRVYPDARVIEVKEMGVRLSRKGETV